MMGMGKHGWDNGIWKLDRNLKLYNLEYIVTKLKVWLLGGNGHSMKTFYMCAWEKMIPCYWILI